MKSINVNRTPATMPKRKEPELTPEEQFKRFQEAAKEHEIEKCLPEIERAFDALAKAPKSKLGLGGKKHREDHS
ncbi:MAG: hypothetical protein ACLQKK_11375 [Rhodomicrobium sp.]